MAVWNELFTCKENQWTGAHPLAVELAAYLKDQPGARILDLGCGAGRHLVYLTQQGFRVEGMDLSRNGLYLARERLLEAGRSAPLTQADMTALPYRENSFDAVVSIHVIFHNRLALIQRTLDEIWRITRPGGAVFLTFQSTLSDRCGHGELLEPGTYIPDIGNDAGVPHHYSTLPELVETLSPFDVWFIRHTFNRSESGEQSHHWEVHLRKPE